MAGTGRGRRGGFGQVRRPVQLPVLTMSLTPPNETISMIDGPALAGYPIVNCEYAVVSTHQRSAATASALKAFLRWVITTGNHPNYVDAVGFQPLPPALVALGKQQIAEIGS